MLRRLIFSFRLRMAGLAAFIVLSMSALQGALPPARLSVSDAGSDAYGAARDAGVRIQTASAGGPVQYLTPPYLQNVRSNAIAIMWELDVAAECAVEYGLDASYGLQTPCTRQPSGAGTEVYRCTLTNLQPGTTYSFRAIANGQPGRAGAFTTAPAEPGPFSFCVWSDSQGSNHGSYDADPLEPTKSMFRHMASSGIQFAVTCGDLAESGSSYADTRRYYLDRVALLLGTRVPWFVAWGNHDGGATSLIRRFADQPSQQRPGYTAGYGSYSFDYAGCHFVCIDYASSAVDIATWLESDLQSTANRNARFTFVFIHIPPYCELWIDGNAGLRATLVPLMEAYGVDVCFSGHTHEYSRGFLNGVYYCVTGGGSWLDFPEVLVADWDHMTVGGQHAIPGIYKPSPASGGGLVNEYVRVDVTENSFTASMIAFSPDGKVLGPLDQFSLTRDPDSRPPLTPVITGPSSFDAFEGGLLELACSAFADPDSSSVHMQSRWRLSFSPDVEAVGGVLFERVTGPGVTNCAIAATNIWPGQVVYASVQHTAGDGLVSAFASPIAIRITPDPLFLEDFESVAEFSLPAGWTATHRTSVLSNIWDPDDPRSNTYLTWTVVSSSRLHALGANRLSVPGIVRGNSVYAESDHRSGVQIQYLTTPDYDLRGFENIRLVFRSNYMQNQDSLAALEFSIDRGATWLPVVYLLDSKDVVFRPGGVTIDAAATFGRVDPDGVPNASGTAASGGTYGEHILSRPFEDLAPHIQGRINDDPIESKRIECFRLPAADRQAAVRFRFVLVGTASWFWGIDDFGLFGSADALDPLRIVSATARQDELHLAWTGPDGPYRVQVRDALDAGSWVDYGAAIDADRRSVVLPIGGITGFYRVRLDR